MKTLVLGSLCIAAFAGILALGLRAPVIRPPEPAPERSLRGPEDGSATAAFEFAAAREKAGDLATAAEYYLRALELNPGSNSAKEKLFAMPESLKAAEEARISSRLLALFSRLEDEKRDLEARSIARLVLLGHPENERAHVMMGDERIDGKWYSKDELELVRISRAKLEENEAWNRMSLRDRKVHTLRLEYDAKWELPLHDRVWLDCAPDAPFVFCLEKSDKYNASLSLEAFQTDAKAYFGQFCRQFGGLFSSEVLCSSAVCPIYVFSTQERYRACTEAPGWLGGHFDSTLGMSFLYRDSSTLTEALFHELTHQMFYVISGVKNGKPLVPTASGECWFLEGLTTYFEGFTREAEGRIVFGVPPGEYLAAAKKRLAGPKRYKLAELMRVTFSQLKDDANAGGRSATQITSQCWAATFFLLIGADGKYRDRYLDYFKLELVGKGGHEAAVKCFGDLGAMDAEYVEFFRTLK
ncbi:MAG: hypothetical protein K8T20_16700 [Planctomycetes bacterium]|nr:hypothetical protein [Planctomycetota bacterium]